MDWAQILVIILAVVLAIFLILSIILVSMLIKVTSQIKAVTSTAQRTAEDLEQAFSRASRVTTPLIIIRTIVKQAMKIKKKR